MTDCGRSCAASLTRSRARIAAAARSRSLSRRSPIRPIRPIVAAVSLKRHVRDTLRDLAARAAAPDPGATGDQLMLLAEGSYAAARSLDSAAISSRAVDAALACLPTECAP